MGDMVLLLLALLAGLLWFWQSTLQARELALRAARDACLNQGLQLLDGTVALYRVGLRRTTGRLLLQRTFQFSYSIGGDDRNTGFVITSGNHVEHVGL
jgi:hypothetical protein